jgi:mono/diheme cytochrome c family protein
MSLFRALVLLVAVVTLRAAGAADPPRDGGYVLLCASCHGPAGRGDGPWASTFDPPPANLRERLLASRDPQEAVRRVLDGRKLVALDPARARAHGTEVEALVTYLERLPGIDWERAERGEEVYVARCETCHGRFGHPSPAPGATGPRPRDLSDPTFQSATSDERLGYLVRHGRSDMPAVPELPSGDLRPLVVYVRLLSPGFELYTRYCASCHGDDGRADDLVEPGTAPMVRFDRDYFAKRDPEVLRKKVWHMLEDRKPRMPHFRGALDEADVRAIVEYLERTR